ncbi:MAG: helix-turn-helix transcriptional regulator [Deltaproteobacteria bacterium]|nr:helix-turn-helix transcriptional regulator [Deltaproteobacteria bacterium]
MDFWKIGPKIREIRKKKGITQQELADRAGLSRQSISNLERGLVGRVTIAVLVKTLDALGYELDIVEKKPLWFFDPNDL